MSPQTTWMLAVTLLLPPGAAAHFMWLTRAHGEAAITFNEAAGKEGAKLFLSMVAERTKAEVAVAPEKTAKSLALNMVSHGKLGALTAPLPATINHSAAMLEGEATWGLFPELNKTSPPLLQYWFSAHRTTHNHDWFYVDARSTNRLSVSLRVLQDECTAGAGAASVVAVTRFDGKNFGPVEVELFDATGAKAGSVTTSERGIAALKFAPGQRVYAMIKRFEHAPGTDPVSGKAYQTVAHYATTEVDVSCAKSAVAAATAVAVAAPSSAAPPPTNGFPTQTTEAAAETARWIVSTGTWGYVTSLAKGGSPTASVFSFSDGVETSTGRLFFYLMGGGGGPDDWDASLTISQAELNHTTSCEAAKTDPEDPRCAKLTLSGVMAKATGEAATFGKAALFARHPAMRKWPASHAFTVYELTVTHVWMIDFYGGGAHVPPKTYYAAKPKHNVPHWPPIGAPVLAGSMPPATNDAAAASVAAYAAAAAPIAEAATVAGGGGGALVNDEAVDSPSIASPPPWNQTAKRARWLVYHARWASVGTVSVHLDGKPWGNVRSVADGVADASTGLPYLYLPTPDPTAVDIRVNAHAVLSFSEAALPDRVTAKGLVCGGMDAEDPTCARLHLIGILTPLKSKADLARAEAALKARHPLAPWLGKGGAHTGGIYYTIDVQSLTFLDFYGGPAKLTVQEYMAASPL